MDPHRRAAFRWLWAASAVSSYGTGLGFGAMAIIAIRALHAGPAQVALLSSVGVGAGALLAVPLGAPIEFRRKRPVMITADLLRAAAQLTVPVAFVLGALTFLQLLIVTALVAGAKIAFVAASGTHLKELVPKDQLLTANARMETTLWSSMVLGPPLGGAAIGLLGTVATITLDAVSYLLSAVGIGRIRTPEPPPPARAPGPRIPLRAAWGELLGHPRLRGPFLNHVIVSALIMATEPLLAILLLARLHYAPWEYGIAFALPCAGGLIGSRLARPLAGRFGEARVRTVAGTLRVGWPIGMALIPAGPGGLVLVVLLQFGLILSIGIYTPLLATQRLAEAAPERLARTLAAWSITSSATIALATAGWGILAGVIGVRPAIALAGVLALPTPLLLLHAPGRLQAASSPA